MKPTSFNPRTRTWARPFPESLSQHDIVYQSPPEDGLQGLPLGNGDLGMLLWTEGGKLVAVVNKVDLFDDSPDAGDGMVDGVEYDHEPTLKHGARLIVDFGMPVFDILYLQQFEARLALADATVRMESKTPFLNIKATAFASNPDNVIVLECEAQCDEPIAVQTLLERFGSRPYPYWYSGFNRDATISLDGTGTSAEGDTVLIRQELRALHFVVGARMIGKEIVVGRQSRHAGSFTTGKSTTVRFTLYITAVTSENSAAPENSVLEILDQAAGKGVKAIHQAHADDWKDFWKASFLSIPNNYLENIWYLNLYHANSSCRAEYPLRFNNGIWGWNRDVSNWAFYFHWNMQNFIWPLHTANHAELTRPYFKFRTRSLANAKIYAKNQQKHKGAFYADVADRHGRNVGSHWNNQTPGAQIALLYWKHFKYTCDRRFLEEQAWPVMLEVTRYYASLVVKGEDGVYRSPCSQAYEGSPLFEEVITDTAMIQALMPAAVECAALVGYARPEVENWRIIGANMNGYHTQPMDDDEIAIADDGHKIHLHGIGKGCEALTGNAFTVGKYLMVEGADREGFSYENLPEYIKKEGIKKGDRIRNRHGNPARPTYYGIPDPEFAPVFPGERIGLKDRGSELFNTSVDQVRMHPTSKPPKEEGQGSMACGSSMCMGWCPYPVVLARLGLAREAAMEIEHSIMAWQFYCQGFGHYGPYEAFSNDKDKRWHTNTVTEHKTGERFLSPAWPFRHFTFEAVPIVCATINEMLLQSYEGVIRLLPAVPADWAGSFLLAAEGGFLVHAQYGDGQAQWVALESRLGRRCKVVNPWGNADVFVTVLDGQGDAAGSATTQATVLGPDAVLEFDTEAGLLYLLCTTPDTLEDWTTETPVFEPNHEMKKLGKAQLGLPRMY